MRVIECRSCGTPHRIIPKNFEEREYPEKIRCIKCWSKSAYKSLSSSSSSSSVSVGSKKSSSKRDSWVTDKDPGNEFQPTYEVGDSVFINTDKHGVLLCQVLDSECWDDGRHIFYSVDVKGTIVDYVEEKELFNTAKEAKKGPTIKVF